MTPWAAEEYSCATGSIVAKTQKQRLKLIEHYCGLRTVRIRFQTLNKFNASLEWHWPSLVLHFSFIQNAKNLASSGGSLFTWISARWPHAARGLDWSKLCEPHSIYLR